jgi:RHS repeat-associated protein
MDFVASQTDTTNNIALSYTYDASGNRGKQIAAGKQTIYTIDPNSNRITKSRKGIASPITYTSDADGSINAYGGTALTYDASERLIGYAGTAGYAYDGLDTRVVKTIGLSSTLFNYDDQKRLLGEYTAGSTNKLIEETVYMGDVPVAVIKPTGIYYVHADYRNAPRQIDNKNKVVAWAWYPQPYGDNLPNNNPSGLGNFVYNLRYPGQYYDSESGFFYNGARYYSPDLGRYISSDPLGIAAGINTYAYVTGNPLNRTDPQGLFGTPFDVGAGAVAGAIGGYVADGPRGAIIGSIGGAVVGFVNPFESEAAGATAASVFRDQFLNGVTESVTGQLLASADSGQSISDSISNVNVPLAVTSGLGGALGLTAAEGLGGLTALTTESLGGLISGAAERDFEYYTSHQCP